jgi:SAM-dependent methyltransferase
MTRSEYADEWLASAEGFRSQGDYAWMAQQLAVQGWVLEVGCGVGISTEALLIAGCRVVVVDNNPDLIAKAKSRLSAANYRFKDGQASQIATYPTADDADVVFVEASILDPQLFVPGDYSAICCWLIGAAPGDIAPVVGVPTEDFEGPEMPRYRLTLQERCFDLGRQLLKSGGVVHLVDRSLAYWSHKDQARAAAAENVAAFAGYGYDIGPENAFLRRMKAAFNKSNIQYVQESHAVGQPVLVSIRAPRN